MGFATAKIKHILELDIVLKKIKFSGMDLKLRNKKDVKLGTLLHSKLIAL